jgi:hypothetical protein
MSNASVRAMLGFVKAPNKPSGDSPRLQPKMATRSTPRQSSNTRSDPVRRPLDVAVSSDDHSRGRETTQLHRGAAEARDHLGIIAASDDSEEASYRRQLDASYQPTPLSHVRPNGGSTLSKAKYQPKDHAEGAPTAKPHPTAARRFPKEQETADVPWPVSASRTTTGKSPAATTKTICNSSADRDVYVTNAVKPGKTTSSAAKGPPKANGRPPVVTKTVEEFEEEFEAEEENAEEEDAEEEEIADVVRPVSARRTTERMSGAASATQTIRTSSAARNVHATKAVKPWSASFLADEEFRDAQRPGSVSRTSATKTMSNSSSDDMGLHATKKQKPGAVPSGGETRQVFTQFRRSLSVGDRNGDAPANGLSDDFQEEDYYDELDPSSGEYDNDDAILADHVFNYSLNPFRGFSPSELRSVCALASDELTARVSRNLRAPTEVEAALRREFLRTFPLPTYDALQQLAGRTRRVWSGAENSWLVRMVDVSYRSPSVQSPHRAPQIPWGKIHALYCREFPAEAQEYHVTKETLQSRYRILNTALEERRMDLRTGVVSGRTKGLAFYHA